MYWNASMPVLSGPDMGLLESRRRCALPGRPKGRRARMIPLLMLVATFIQCGDPTLDQISGIVLMARPVQGASVCLDIDANLQCGEHEPWATSDSEGRFVLDRLEPGDDISRAIVIASVSPDGDGEEFGAGAVRQLLLLSLPGRVQVVSPFSTLTTLWMWGSGQSNPEDAWAFIRDKMDFPQMNDADGDYSESSDEWDVAALLLASLMFEARAQEVSGNWRSVKTALSNSAVAIVENSDSFKAALAQLGEISPPVNAGIDDLAFRELALPEAPGSIGTGFDSDDLSALTQARAVRFAPDLAVACRNETSVSFSFVESDSEVWNSLKVSARATLDLKVASASGSVEYSEAVDEKKQEINLSLDMVFVGCEYSGTSFELDEKQLTKVSSTGKYEPAPALFQQHFDDFHRKYGDRFLSSVTTGGHFKAVLKIEAGSREEKKRFKIAISATVLGIKIFSASYTKAMNDLIGHYNATIYYYAPNTGGTRIPALEWGQVQNAVDAFTSHMNSPRCHDPSTYRACPYLLANYSDYGAILSTVPPEYLLNRDRLYTLEALGREAVALNDVRAGISQIRLDPSLYNDFEPANLDEIESKTVFSQAALLTSYNRCKESASYCTTHPLDESGTASSLASRLPRPRLIWPQSCTDLKESGLLDGNHVLYFGGDPGLPYDVFCQGMATPEPKTYLELGTISPVSMTPSYNYSRYLGVPAASGEYLNAVLVFHKILIMPLPTGIAIMPGQTSFVNSTAGNAIDILSGFHNGLSFGPGLAIHFIGPDNPGIMANIDLTGTALRFAGTNQFGVGNGGGSNLTVLSDDGKRLNLILTIDEGAEMTCREILPTGDFLLEYDVASP